MEMNRIPWIDNMKAVGMYFIILGHFFPHGYKYIYVFNVPVFFVISGYLCKQETNAKSFWKKILTGLVLPLIVLNITNYIIIDLLSYFNGNHNIFYLSRFLRFIWSSLIGMQSGLKELWYVYTLILLKIVSYYFCTNGITKYFMLIMSVCWILIKPIGVEYENAIENVWIAYPFFFVGQFLRKYMQHINTFEHNSLFVGLAVLCCGFVWLCGYYNGFVQMYRCQYGNNVFLFVFGGLAGTAFLFFFSKMFSRGIPLCTNIAKGSILRSLN